MMKQFFSLKAKHPDALLLFRCGDFYETYGDDAIVASQILGITLTKRNNGGNTGDTPMAGFPHHAWLSATNSKTRRKNAPPSKARRGSPRWTKW